MLRPGDHSRATQIPPRPSQLRGLSLTSGRSNPRIGFNCTIQLNHANCRRAFNRLSHRSGATKGKMRIAVDLLQAGRPIPVLADRSPGFFPQPSGREWHPYICCLHVRHGLHTGQGRACRHSAGDTTGCRARVDFLIGLGGLQSNYSFALSGLRSCMHFTPGSRPGLQSLAASRLSTVLFLSYGSVRISTAVAEVSRFEGTCCRANALLHPKSESLQPNKPGRFHLRLSPFTWQISPDAAQSVHFNYPYALIK
jgi:hypothetical protein